MHGTKCSRHASTILGQPFSAPSVVDMMRFWKMMNTMATGIVISTAAASCSGYWLPVPSCPETSEATAVVSGFSFGDCR